MQGIDQSTRRNEFVFRPRLARYDRPAADVEELLRVEGADFIHISCWTILGRRAERVEHLQWTEFLSGCESKEAFLQMMSERSDALADVDVPGIKALLQLRRLSGIAIAGPCFALLVSRLAGRSGSRSTHCVNNMFGKVRWFYRHARKRGRAIAAKVERSWIARRRYKKNIRNEHDLTYEDMRTIEIYHLLLTALEHESRKI